MKPAELVSKQTCIATCNYLYTFMNYVDIDGAYFAKFHGTLHRAAHCSIILLHLYENGMQHKEREEKNKFI